MSGSTGSSLTAPSSINDLRTQAHLQIGQRLGKIDLTPILLYTLNQNVPDGAIPFLAWQFDVLQPWWSLLASITQQRALIGQAIALHRTNGTVFAIEQILNSLGFPFVTIQEGQNIWGGTQFPPSQGWAVFRVLVSRVTPVLASPQPTSWDTVTDIDLLIDVDETEQSTGWTEPPISAQPQSLAVSAINFFKPERSLLDSLRFQELPINEPTLNVTDFLSIIASNFVQESPLTVTDFLQVTGFVLADTKTTAPFYNAHFYHAGLTYGASQPAVVDSGIVVNGSPTE